MSGNSECTICTYINPDENQDTKYNKQEVLYNGHDGTISICLCRSHSMELFKYGQMRFLVKYLPVASKYENKANYKLLKFMKVALEAVGTARTA